MRSIFFIQQCFLIACAVSMATGKATKEKVLEFGRVTKQDHHIVNNEVLIRKLLDEDLRFLSFSMSMSMSMPSETPKPSSPPTTPTPSPISDTDSPTYTEETTFSPEETSEPTPYAETDAPTRSPVRSPVSETSAPTGAVTSSPTGILDGEDGEASINAPLTAEGSAKANGGMTAAAVALSAAAGVVIVVAAIRKLRPRSVAGFEKCDTDSEGETMANTSAAV